MKNLSSVLTEQVSIRICGLCSYESTGLSMLLFSNSVMPNSLQPHGLQPTRLPRTSLSLWVCSNSLSKWYYLTILILCCPLLFTSVFPSIRVFSSESALHIRWSKYWSFCFSISPSNEYAGLSSLRIDWFDLRDVQRTLRSLLWHHNLKASFLWCSAFCMVQLSHPYLTTRKNI